MVRIHWVATLVKLQTWSLLLYLRVTLYADAPQVFRYLCSLTSHWILCIPSLPMCFDGLMILEFAFSHHWKQWLKATPQICRFCYKPFFRRVSLSLSSSFIACLKLTSLLKRDSALGYLLRIHVFRYSCNNTGMEYKYVAIQPGSVLSSALAFIYHLQATIKRCSTETCIPLKPLLLCNFSVSIVEILKEHSPEGLIFSKVSEIARFYAENWSF